MKAVAILNKASGGLINASCEEWGKDIQSAFHSEGHEIDVNCVEPVLLEETLDKVILQDIDCVVIGGGDGTVRAAAERLVGQHLALGVIPLGTFNRFARDLGLPTAPAKAAGSLACGNFQRIDVGLVNDRLFLNNSIIGLPLQFTEARQKLRGRPLFESLEGYFRAFSEILRRGRRLELEIDDGNDDERTQRSVRALTLAISNNPYDEELGLGFTRKKLDTGRLGFYISRHRTVPSFLWVLLRAAVGFWRGDPDFDSSDVKSIVIRSRHKRLLKMSNDGEVEELEMPLHYRIRPQALRVLMPGNAS